MTGNDLFDGPQRKRKKNIPFIPSIAPPYTQKWPEMQKQHQKMIIDEVKSVFQEKMADQWLIKKKRKLLKNGAVKGRSVEDSTKLLNDIIKKQDRYENMNANQLLSSLDDPGKIKDMKEFKSFASIGTNDIERSLEKKSNISLIVSCGAGDEWMCQSLLCQALVSGVPICNIQGLASILSECLDVNNISAIAFKKLDQSPFSDLVEFIVDKIPDVSSSWTKLWKCHEEPSDGPDNYMEMNIKWRDRPNKKIDMSRLKHEKRAEIMKK